MDVMLVVPGASFGVDLIYLTQLQGGKFLSKGPSPYRLKHLALISLVLLYNLGLMATAAVLHLRQTRAKFSRSVNAVNHKSRPSDKEIEPRVLNGQQPSLCGLKRRSGRTVIFCALMLPLLSTLDWRSP